MERTTQVSFAAGAIPDSFTLDAIMLARARGFLDTRSSSLVPRATWREPICVLEGAHPVKGVILAAGAGSRLYPATRAVPKPLVPVLDKPMLFYPLSTVLAAGLSDITIVVAGRDHAAVSVLLGDGSRLGASFTYAVQEQPRGPADALRACAHLLDDEVFVVLSDILIDGAGVLEVIASGRDACRGCVVFTKDVPDPRAFGVVESDADGLVTNIEEKPCVPRTNRASVGLFMYDREIAPRIETLRMSPRGELELTALSLTYVDEGRAVEAVFGADTAWFDMGTPISILQAAAFVNRVWESEGRAVGCIEEAAFRGGLIGRDQLAASAEEHGTTRYGRYIRRIAEASD